MQFLSYLFLFIVFSFAFLFSPNLHAQSWLDKIKKKAEEKSQEIQEKIIEVTEEKTKDKAEEASEEEFTELRTSYDTATFGYAIAFIDNTDLYEEKQKGQKLKRFFIRFSDELGTTDETQKDPLKKAKDYYDLGEIAYSSHFYKRAEQSFLKSEEEFERLNQTSHPLYSKLINNLGLLYYSTKKLSEAEIYIQKALEISKNKKNENYTAALNNQAMIWKDKGFYTESEKQFAQLKELQIKNDQALTISHAIVLNNQAILFQELGRYREAETCLSQAMETAALTLKGTSNTYQRFLINQALLYQQMKRYQEAEQLFLQSIELKESRFGTRNHPDLAHMLTGLAALYIEMEKTEKTEDLLLEAERIYEKKLGTNNLSYATASDYLGQFYKNQNRLEEAEKQLKKALKIRQNQLGNNHIKTIETQEHLALLYWKKGNIEESKELFEDVISHNYEFIKNYFPAMSEVEKERYWDKIHPVFLRFYCFVSDTERKQPNKYPDLIVQMHNAHLATKAILLNTTNRIKESVLKSNNWKLKNDYKKWIKNREELIELYSYTPEELKEQGIDREKLEKETNQIEKKLSESLPELFDDKDLKTYQDIKNALPQNTAFVDIISFPNYENDKLIGNQYIALVGTPTSDAPKLIHLKNGKELDKGDFYYYCNTVRLTIENEESFVAYWKPIYDILEEIKQKQENEKIFVSLDGIYNQININTLRLDDGSYVIDHQNLVFLNNLKDLTKNKKTTIRNNQIVLVGFPNYGNTGKITPLPGTKEEIENIQKLLRGYNQYPKVILGNAADEKTIKSIKSPRILHIATHGFFLADDAMSNSDNSRAFGLQANLVRQNPLLRSGLMFTNAESALETKTSKEKSESNNGILTAYEARGLNLEGTELVVLSACETGLGDVKAGEGVYGLQRAFQLAGAKSTIMSLWQVSDEATAKLMTYFYQHLAQNDNVNEAFQKAQTKLKEEYPDPYFWGAFMLLQTEK
ncbi:CHAT domain-containing tetratricopeptide repeat protein [Bernardetia sp.]|uniref:CHAT domain-containing tetratricopeptide repeat protein n=1 Tax=Bernardetia sp. TaxID=1937974 RepID=UPI0025C0A65A|nr:CHAT domain-containing tetratricopeptide repeat protein [Bernardetia sp.]